MAYKIHNIYKKKKRYKRFYGVERKCFCFIFLQHITGHMSYYSNAVCTD